MAGGEGGVGAEDRADFKDVFPAGRHGHLFVELRRLRQVGFAVEINHFEQLGAAFRWAAHDLGRMHFDETVLDPILAHGHFDRGLDFKDDQVFLAAQVEIAPVHAQVLGGQVGGEGIERQGRVGGIFDLQRFELDFEPTQLDHRVIRPPCR